MLAWVHTGAAELPSRALAAGVGSSVIGGYSGFAVDEMVQGNLR